MSENVSVGKVEFQLISSSENVVTSLNKVEESLSDLSSTSGKSSKSLESTIGSLEKLGNIQFGEGFTKLQELSATIKALSAKSFSNTTPKNIVELSKSLEVLSRVQLDVAKFKGILSIIDKLTKFKGFRPSNITKMISAVKGFEDLKIDKVVPQIKELAKAMSILDRNMKNVADGFKAMNSVGVKLSKSIQVATRQHHGIISHVGSVWKMLHSQFMLLQGMLFAITGVFSKFANKANAFVENMNLFSVAMGKAANSELEFANQAERLLGIDLSGWIRDQGFFQQMITGFGMANDQATLMSRNLTQLAYDASSFFNISVEDSMKKFQSGIAGELEPLRRIGYALDEATLRHIAMAHGVDVNIRSLTQAEKAQLRYIAIMEQSKNVMGDLARTINTPANAMRIFKMQIEQVGRALGQVLIPLLSAVMPYLVGIAQLLRDIFSLIASLLGFEMPVIDYSGLGGGASEATAPVENLGNALDKAGGKASKAKEKIKEFKNYLLGFDQLHVIPSQAKDEPKDDSLGGGAGGGGKGGAGGGLGKLKLPEYNFLKGITSGIASVRDKLQWVFDLVKRIIDTIKKHPTATKLALLGTLVWKFAKKLTDLLMLAAPLKKLFWRFGIDGEAVMRKLGISVAVLAGEYLVLTNVASNLYKNNGKGLGDWLFGIGAIAGASAILYKFWGPAGLIVAGVVAVVGVLKGIRDAKLEQGLEKFYGHITLTTEQVKTLAKTIHTNDFTIRLKGIKEANVEIDGLLEKYEQLKLKFKQEKMMANMGVKFNEDEMKQSLEGLIQTSSKLAEQSQIKLSLTFDFGDNSNPYLNGIKDKILGSNATLVEQIRQKGEQLKRILAEGFKDGEWILEKETEAKKLAQELQEITDKIAEREHKIRLKQMSVEIEHAKMGTSDGKLSAETMQKLMENLTELVNEDFQSHSLRVATALVQIEEFGLEHGMLKEEIAKVQEYVKTEMESSYVVAQLPIIVNTLDEAGFFTGFAEQLEIFAVHASPAISEAVATALRSSDPVVAIEAINELISSIEFGTNQAIQEFRKSIGDEGTLAIEHMVESMKPTFEQLDSLRETARKMGVVLPDEIGKKLRDSDVLRALAGDVGALARVTGRDAIKSVEFMEALRTQKDFGKNVSKSVANGLKENLSIVKDGATGVVIGIRDVFTGAVSAITPEMKSNLEQMGFDMSKGLEAPTREMLEKMGLTTEQIQKIMDKFAKDQSLTYETLKTESGKWFDVVQKEAQEMPELFGKSLDKVTGLFESFKKQKTSKSYGDEMDVILRATNSATDGMVRSTATWKDRTVNHIDVAIGKWKEYARVVNGEYNVSTPTTKLPPHLRGASSSRGGARVSAYATGGFPTAGELFIANESGAEMIGKIGSKSAVVNNEQIIQGVARGVFEAMVAVNGMNEKKSGDTLVVMVDGETRYEQSLDNMRRQNQRAGKVIIPV